MKKLLAISILLLSLCNMNVVRCALMRLGDNSGDGMSRVVVSEDAELRDQANHANYLCLLPQYIRAIIDGYAVGPHLLPRIKKDWEKDIFSQDGGRKKKKGISFEDSTGLFKVTVKKVKKESWSWNEVINNTFLQKTYVNGGEQKRISCVTEKLEEGLVSIDEWVQESVSCWPFSVLKKATAACMQEIETAEGCREFQIFTPLIKGEEKEEMYDTGHHYFDSSNRRFGTRRFVTLKKKVCAIGLLRPGYVEDLAAVALRVKNERKVIE